ncbi:unnamed protein product [Rotaria sp. Silwood1]|nr:unnamed protein product [Rotaria sp. Silwood1]
MHQVISNQTREDKATPSSILNQNNNMENSYITNISCQSIKTDSSTMKINSPLFTSTDATETKMIASAEPDNQMLRTILTSSQGYSPLPALDDLTIHEWHNLTSSTDQCIEFCQHVSLLHVYPTKPCKKMHNNWYLGSSSTSNDQGKWRCSTYSYKFIRKNVQILDYATIVDWKNFMHDLCGEYFIRLPAIIGVVNHVVEIDESAWTKRKYNRGHHRDAATLMPIIHQYILPGTTIYSDQRRAYNAITNGRDGSDRYVHETVNHSHNFVDPTT